MACVGDRKGPQIADALFRAISGRRLRLYARAGLVTTFDGRQYSLEDELHHLMLDSETYKFDHFGEGTQPGRHWDDRATAIGLALQAPELDLGGTEAMQGVVAQFFVGQAAYVAAQRDAETQRLFRRGPVSFAPMTIRAQHGRDRFGFTRRY